MIWLWLASVLSGALLVLSYPPFPNGSLVWIALTPTVLALHLLPKPRPVFGPGYLLGLIYFSGTFWWIGHVTIGGTSALCAYLALYPALWLWLMQRWITRWPVSEPRMNLLACAVAACAWVLLEWVRGWFLTGFSWNYLGVALYKNLPMLQLSALGGVLLISWLVVFINVMAARLILQFLEKFRSGQTWRRGFDLWVTLFGTVLVFSYGFRQSLRAPTGAERTLRYAAVQANIPQEAKFQAMSNAEILEKHRQLSTFALATRPDLLLWPETATGQQMFGDPEFTRTVLELAQDAEGSFVLGAIEATPGRSYNAAFHLGPGAEVIEVYRKRHLVPFGEYAPLADYLPFMRQLVPFQIDYSPGEKGQIFTLPKSGLRLAPVICFEDTLPAICRDAVAPGADILLNITNDAWFKSSPGATQHLANAIFRTVELDMPLLRSSNSGITCAIDQSGRMVDLLQIDGHVTEIDGVLTGVLTWTPSRVTPYERWGEWIVLLSAAVCLIVAGFQRIRKA